MIVSAIKKVVEKENLSQEEAQAVMEEVMSGKATEAQIGSLLTALRMKEETVEELTGFALAMRRKAEPVVCRTLVDSGMSGTGRELLVDTCGTGGDASGTFNVSTATAFTVAGCGLRVAKHGNRSFTSLCGSADVLEALGVKISLEPSLIGKCIDEIGIGFLFAPNLHLAMKYVMPSRRQLAIRTVFNILGPLTNPAGAQAQVIGVYDGNVTEKMALALGKLGTEHAFVVHGADGLDEISNTGESKISEIRAGILRTYHIKPEEFNIPRCQLKDLAGGQVAENAEIIKAILKGEKGPKRDIVLLNAAAAIVAGNKAPDITQAIKIAEDSLDSGKALTKLRAIVEFTNSLPSTQ
ncbi:MAG: anthranilate phosphoribosyltransferase [Candidatus Tectomicrobia bacterium]|uniref:Anthranilate phosphoribosyltransferase n=1 Tax=Tectimicrobiota bacterium TaxID=2528274 RepID=A0A933GN61_UNCTE|nr:anthranilate phosphoribosyltransferase [Candidatus Tectomicrobia bacterium]